ncbi:MAG: type II toxin-antitoxin system Phd/YefM family antitoxin [Chloroflexi bacterium]|nr:type II toxin-antitoxin system Phd/YefM family antitoxin [Chloroflexota bacterium]
MSTTLTIQEAQAQLSQLLELAQAGHEVIIHDPQKGKAKLVAIAGPPPQGPRVFGLHEGQVWMSDDFGAPLPDSFWLGEKGE